MDPQIKPGICVFDLHYPEHDKVLWENILALASTLKLEYFVFGGDNLDMSPVSHWLIDKGDRKHLEGKRLKADYDGFQSEILDPLEKLLPDYCRKVLMFGNHEEWIDKYIDKSPELEGFAEIDRNLKLQDWEVYPYKKNVKVGKLYFHHGEFTSKHHASKTVDTYCRPMVTGHTHTFQIHTKTTAIDSDPITSYSMPCACKRNPLYMKDKSSAWVNGFGVFYIQENGDFNLYPVLSKKGHFVFNGRYY